MAWKNGMELVTANKLFERYGVSIAQDPNTKIYTATLGDRTIQHTSVTAIAETILEKWFTANEVSAEPRKKRRAPLFGSMKGQISMSDDFDKPLEEFENY